MNYHIRPVRPSDAEAIADIYAHYVRHTCISFETVPPTADEMRQRIRHIADGHPYFVAETEEQRIVGYCYAHPWKDRAAYARTFETTIYLAIDAHRQGIGSALMQKLITACRTDTEAHVLVACITQGNEPSERLHESLGFRLASRFHEVGRKFGRWLDVVDYEMVLK